MNFDDPMKKATSERAAKTSSQAKAAAKKHMKKAPVNKKALKTNVKSEAAKKSKMFSVSKVPTKKTTNKTTIKTSSTGPVKSGTKVIKEKNPRITMHTDNSPVSSPIMMTPREKRRMVTASGDECFWLCDGRILADLKDLSGALRELEDEVFGHHVTSDRHDFANWVADVLCDGDCAARLRQTTNRRDAYSVIIETLSTYY